MVNLFLTLILLLLCAGCGQPCHQFSTRESFDQVRKTTRAHLAPETLLKEHTYCTLQALEDVTVDQLSLQEAISMALKNNPGLQATFQELGIAQADLVQAGLFTNPEIAALFRIPHNEEDDENIEVDAPILNIADLWRVPLAKQVAEDELEATTQQVLETILSVYAETKIAYYHCLFAKASYDLVREAIDIAQTYLDWIEYRYDFGFETKRDVNLAWVRLQNWQSMYFMWHAELHNAFTHLTKLLGTKVTPEPFALTENFQHEDTSIAHLENLEDLALINRPEMNMQRMKVRRAYHNISLQRALALNDVRLGVTYKLDFEKQRGTGPAFGMQIPFFDWNQAGIKRAKVEAEMQDKLLLQTKRDILAQVQMNYRSYLAGLQEINLHKKALKNYQDAISFTQTYANKMMFSRSVIYKTQLDYIQERMAYMDRHFQAHTHFARLEQAIGKQVH